LSSRPSPHLGTVPPPRAAPAHSGGPGPAAAYGRRDAVRFSVALWVGVGVCVWALAALAPTLMPANDGSGVPGWAPPVPAPGGASLGSSLERWDALWYLRISEDGYRAGDGSAAFFPLYPLLVRGLSELWGGHPLPAALLLSHGAWLAALVVLVRALADDLGAPRARAAVLLLALFPTAFFFYAPYPESLLLLLSVTALWSARRGRWAVAGGAAALASATRAAGLVVMLPLAFEVFRAARARRPDNPFAGALGAPLVALLAAPLGTVLYLLYWQVRFGDPWAPLTQQALWLRQPTWPWDTLLSATSTAWDSLGAWPRSYHLLDWLVVVPLVVVALWTTSRLPPAYRLYVWGSLLVPLCFVWPGRPLMSVPRFLLLVWPLFAGLASLLTRPLTRAAVLAVSGAGLALFTILFVNWYWIF
jgi:hypothetical protein